MGTETERLQGSDEPSIYSYFHLLPICSLLLLFYPTLSNIAIY